jgi:periplasmic protein TonB
MHTAMRCDGVRVGGLGATFALHVLAIVVVCMPAALPDRVPEHPSTPLQWVSAVTQPDIVPAVPLPPPPAPPPRPPRTVSPVRPVAEPVVPIVATDVPAIAAPTSAASVTGVATTERVEVVPPVSTSMQAPSAGSLAYARIRDPIYPPDALRRGEQGVVVLRVAVAADGTVDRVEIEHSSGSSRLDRAARDAVRQWRFRPPLVGGVPAAATGLVPVVFRLPEHA